MRPISSIKRNEEFAKWWNHWKSTIQKSRIGKSRIGRSRIEVLTRPALRTPSGPLPAPEPLPPPVTEPPPDSADPDVPIQEPDPVQPNQV